MFPLKKIGASQHSELEKLIVLKKRELLAIICTSNVTRFLTCTENLLLHRILVKLYCRAILSLHLHSMFFCLINNIC